VATLVVGAIGATVGAFFGGPLGASIGWSLGSALGGALFPNRPAQVPHDLHLQGSSYGAFRKIIYGTVRISGNVTWETDLQEHDGGGKGKEPEQSTFTASFDVGLCETQVVSVLRFWAAGRLNYDINQPDGPDVPFVLYDGNATQLPDPTEEAAEGVGNVPAYRGVSRVVFTDWDMTQFGNSIPQLSFELATKGTLQDLRIVLQNDDTGKTFQGFSCIAEWDSPDSIPVVTNVNVGVTYSVANSNGEDYDPVDLSATGVHATTIIYPQWWNGIAFTNYFGMGNYKYADDSVVQLHFGVDVGEITASDENPTIISSATVTAVLDPVHSVYNAFDSTKFVYNAGVPAGLFCYNAAMTQDGTAVFVFTRPTAIASTDHWYKIVDGAVVDDGAIDAGIQALFTSVSGPYCQTGKPHGVAGDGTIMNSLSVENNGTFFWYMQGASQTVFLLEIDSGGTLVDSGASLSIPFSGASPNGGIEGCIRSLGTTGYAGVAKGHNLFLLSRVGDQELTYLSEVVADLCDRAGLDPSQYDVTQLSSIVVDGYVIEQQITIRQAIETLMPVYFFDAVESDGVIKFVVRGADPIVTFEEDDLAAHTDSDDLPALLSCVHTQDADLPSSISISYMNKEADYQINSQTWQRMTGGNGDVQTIQVPLVLTDQHAKQIVDAWGFNALWERDAYTWYSSRKYAKYEPTDVCIVMGKTIRITSKTEGATGVIKWEGVPSRAANYIQAGVAGTAFNPGQTLQPTVATQVVLLDIPMIEDSDNQNGFYAAMAPAGPGSWPGGSLWKSSDGGSNYERVATAVSPATIGAVTEVLGDFPGGNTFDESHAVTVTIGAGGGTLASETELAVLNGANTFLIGNEIVQAKNCVLTAPSTYLVSGFLRGRRGTEAEIPLHVAGETFIDLSTVSDVDAPFNDLGQTRLYKAVTLGQSLASGTPASFINYGAKLRPYSPAQLGGGSDTVGNVTINWNRRTRIGGAWADYTDVILGESTEGYVLQIWSEDFQEVARIVTGLTSPTFTYTAAMQVTDFGATQQTIFVSVGQVGAYTLGAQATATIAGIGGSNSAPLNPQIPHNNPPPITGAGCSGTVIADTLNWATPTYIFSPDGFGGADQTWLLSFTTGSITAGRGVLTAFAGSGDQLPMGGKLTAEPCGQPLPPSKERLPLSSLVQFAFYMTGNPNPGKYPTLLPSTTYYFSVTRPSVGAAMSAILLSPGN